MRPLRPALVLAVLLAAAPAAAITPGEAARVIAAVRAAGCSMDEVTADRVFDPMGIDRPATADVVTVLEAAGLASVSADGSVLTLAPALCAADPAGDAAAWTAAEAAALEEPGRPGRAARFIAAIRANGCRMTEAEAAGRLGPMGFTADETLGYVDVLVAAGHATLSEDFEELRLAEALCAADPAADGATYAAALAAWEATRPPPSPESAPMDEDELLAAVRAEFGPEAVAEMAAFIASMEGCGLALAPPGEAARRLETAMAEHVGSVFDVPPPLPAAVADALAADVAAFLADPGPDFALADGRLVLKDCTP